TKIFIALSRGRPAEEHPCHLCHGNFRAMREISGESLPLLRAARNACHISQPRGAVPGSTKACPKPAASKTLW
ncbi:hypothetical protein HGM15179_009897, partial [Zosterops borbonicus]